MKLWRWIFSYALFVVPTMLVLLPITAVFTVVALLSHKCVDTLDMAISWVRRTRRKLQGGQVCS